MIVNYNGSAQKAEAVVDEIKALGKDSEAYQCNVANTADVDAMIKDVIKRYGSLDILVNNAGITRDNLIMKMSEEDFDAVIDANLKGCFNTIKAVSRQMLKQRAGRIINITSVYTDNLSCNICCLFRCQISCHIGNIFRLSETSQRNLLRRCLFYLIREHLGHLCIHEARRNAIDRDTAACQLSCHGLGKTDDARLGCCIICLARLYPDL